MLFTYLLSVRASSLYFLCLTNVPTCTIFMWAVTSLVLSPPNTTQDTEKLHLGIPVLGTLEFNKVVGLQSTLLSLLSSQIIGYLLFALKQLYCLKEKTNLHQCSLSYV